MLLEVASTNKVLGHLRVRKSKPWAVFEMPGFILAKWQDCYHFKTRKEAKVYCVEQAKKNPGRTYIIANLKHAVVVRDYDYFGSPEKGWKLKK